MIRRAILALLPLWMLAACAAVPRSRQVPDAPVRNTLWALQSLAGNPVKAPTQPARQAQFVLHVDDNRSTGSGGCNRFTGTYSLDGTALRFGPQATTRMACDPGTTQEQAFFAALARTDSWRIKGDQLWLIDTAGKTLAQFDALYLR